MRAAEWLFIAALVLYTVAIVWHRVTNEVRVLIAVVFGVGLLHDVMGTFFLCVAAANSWRWNTHSISGLAALLIMAGHFAWYVAALRMRGRWETSFHRWSVLAWFVWLVAFVSGIPSGVWLQCVFAFAIAVLAFIAFGIARMLYVPTIPPNTDRVAGVEAGTVLDPSRKQRRYSCGHDGPKTFRIGFFGRVSDVFRNSRQCPSCIIAVFAPHVIRCAWCGGPIYPGDGVALYPLQRGMQFGIISTAQDGRAIGCMGWECCDSGIFYAGTWSTQGFVPAFGGNTMGEQVLATGETVVVNSIS